MAINWHEDDPIRADDNPLECGEEQSAGLGAVVWLLTFALMTIIAGLLAAAGAILGG